MGFMAHEVTVNSEIQAKLYEEIEAMEAELQGKTISYEQIQGLKYMDQVVCESMRKWPVVPVSRVAVAIEMKLIFNLTDSRPHLH